MSNNFWDKEELLGEWDKNSKDKIRLKRVTKKGSTYIDLRTYYPSREDDTIFLPGKGIAIPDDLVDDIADKMIDSSQKK